MCAEVDVSWVRPLVIGVGNRFRRDDGAGPAVVSYLLTDSAGIAAADLMEADGEAARLVELWDGRPLVVVVDAAVLPGRDAGEVVVLQGSTALDPGRVGSWNAGVSGHNAGLSEAVALGRTLGRLPEELVIVGIVAADLSAGEEMSRPVAEAVGSAVEVVRERLAAHERSGGSDVSV